jgi:peptide-methionine (S)-S-oxide reductase
MIFNACNNVSASVSIPDPKVDDKLTATKGEQIAVFAGGCFWGVEAVFDQVKGVSKAESGYAGGSASTADYYTVSSGATGHAESVRVTYDPSQITYGQLLKVFFSVAHDPTELNRQGPDVGSQYRSAVFFANDEQKRIAESYIKQLDEAKLFSGKIVTQVVPLAGFYTAEDYHQNYLVNHPNEPYIVYNDMPKLVNLRKLLPALCKQR